MHSLGQPCEIARLGGIRLRIPLMSATQANDSALPSGLSWSGTYVGIGTVRSGTYTIKVTATDKASTSTTFQLTINNAAPVFTGSASNRAGVVGTALSITQPGATDANGDPLTYTSMVVGPPGQPDVPLPSWLQFNPASLTWSGTPPAAGTWQIVYWAIDGRATPVSMVFTLTVNNPVPQPPVYNGGIPDWVDLSPKKGGSQNYTFPATAFSSPAGEALTYTATQSNGSALPAFLTFNGATRTFTATSSLNDRQTTVTLKATDTDGRWVTHTFSFDILGYGTNAIPIDGGLGMHAAAAPDGMQATQQVSQQATQQSAQAANIQAYWFTYDAANRVDIDGGDLVNGQIQLVARTGSVEHLYDQAGEVVTQLSNGGVGYGIQTQTFRYDARGEQLGSTLTGGQVETKQYDADGRLVADVYTYAPGTIIHYTSADFPNNSGKLYIGGWLSGATTYYYGADGELTASFSYSRVNADQNYWNNLARQIDNGADPSAQSAIPPSLPSLQDAANGAGYGVLGHQSHVTHWDPATGTGGYDREKRGQVHFPTPCHARGLRKGERSGDRCAWPGSQHCRLFRMDCQYGPPAETRSSRCSTTRHPTRQQSATMLRCR